MTADEKQKWLREQLDVVSEAIQDAKDESFYGDIPELIKCALELLEHIHAI